MILSLLVLEHIHTAWVENCAFKKNWNNANSFEKAHLLVTHCKFLEDRSAISFLNIDIL